MQVESKGIEKARRNPKILIRLTGEVHTGIKVRRHQFPPLHILSSKKQGCIMRPSPDSFQLSIAV